MSTNPISEQLRDAAQVVESACKSMKGKYDGRRNNGRKKTGVRAYSKPGPKPLWVKNLTKNKASRSLQAIDAIASPEEIYSRAIAANLLSLAWQVRCDIENRLYGKPYTAINPDEKAKPATITDNRLQIAIQQLIPGPKPKRVKTIEAQPALPAGQPE